MAKKKGKKAFDRDAMANQTREQFSGDMKNRGSSRRGIIKEGVDHVRYNPQPDEDHTIDIVPFKCGKNMPMRQPKMRERVKEKGQWAYTYEYYVHTDVGPMKMRVLCLEMTYGLPCPICEHKRELISSREYDFDENPLKPKQRNLYNIISSDSRKEKKKGVQLFDVAHWYFQKHLEALVSKAERRAKKKGGKKAIDTVVDPGDTRKKGVSIEWTIEGAGKGKDSFDRWFGHELVKRGYAISEEHLAAAHQLDSIVEIPEYKDVYELYWDEKFDDGSGKKKKKKDKGKKAAKGKCPAGGKYGKDYDNYDECISCDLWKKCSKKSKKK